MKDYPKVPVQYFNFTGGKRGTAAALRSLPACHKDFLQVQVHFTAGRWATPVLHPVVAFPTLNDPPHRGVQSYREPGGGEGEGHSYVAFLESCLLLVIIFLYCLDNIRSIY